MTTLHPLIAINDDVVLEHEVARINALGGAQVVLTPTMRMDKRRVIQEAYAALGQPIPGPLLNPIAELCRAVDTAEAEGEEGGGAPEWVPENAKVHIEFNNNRAWTETSGEVEIDTLVGTDPDTENYWGASAYNESDLTEDGLTNTDSTQPALIGEALTKLLGGATVRVQFVASPAGPGGWFVMSSANGAAALQIGPEIGGNVTVSGANEELVVLTSVLTTDPGALNAIAFTLVDARFEIAASGSEEGTATLDNPSEFPPESPLSTALLDFGGSVQTVTLYDALPDTTGLSALSEILP